MANWNLLISRKGYHPHQTEDEPQPATLIEDCRAPNISYSRIVQKTLPMADFECVGPIQFDEIDNIMCGSIDGGAHPTSPIQTSPNDRITKSVQLYNEFMTYNQERIAVLFDEAKRTGLLDPEARIDDFTCAILHGVSFRADADATDEHGCLVREALA